ncbi:MAG: single-stranded-DNA-specific exonuclease RecJ [Christensenellaceae bacterium]
MINYRFDFDNNTKLKIQELSQSTNLQFETCAILYSRGVDTPEKTDYFLHPSKSHFKDPFLLSGMTEAVERIKQAKNEGEVVAVYGDYDADGINATAVLYYALKDFGIDALTVVPERSIGYGLQREVLDKLLDEHFPTLLITVDCGISCYDEVEYLKECGVDVIVTDHHELPEKLPDCTVINCKIKSGYGFDSLCGAGVAYKLAYALIGEKANDYLDFTAIATIADSMPVIDENRDIVYEGVKLIKSGKAHKCVNELLLVSNMKEVSATSLAFTIAPRINAAGRMGDAKSALEFVTTSDSQRIEELAIKLNNYNVTRQQECDKLYRDARQKLIRSGYDKKIIVLSDNNWNSGLVGIIAAKLVEEFSRPVILFVENDGKLHGSARSIENVNIFDAISYCKELLTDFGGHAQAAGVSVNSENYEAFKQKIEKYIDEKFGYEYFKPQKAVEFRIDRPFTLKLAKEINLLEPFGTGNKRPLFSVKVGDVCCQPIKPGSPHLSIRTEYIDLLYFNGQDMLGLINAGTEKEIVFEPNISIYNREESLKGYVKSIDFIVENNEKVRLDGFRSSLLTALNDNDDFLYVSNEMTNKVLSTTLNEHYGTIYAVYNLDNVKYYEGLDGLDYSVYRCLNKNLLNNVVVALDSCDVSGYRRIVYLDRPLAAVPSFPEIAETFIDRSLFAFDYKSLKCDKQTFGKYFHDIKNNLLRANDSVDYALKQRFTQDRTQLVFVLEVFLELEFFSFKNGALRINRTAKTSLDASKIYTEVLKTK